MKIRIYAVSTLLFAGLTIVGCTPKASQNDKTATTEESHEGHDHSAEGHDHEGHDHSAEGHDHEAGAGHEGHDHETVAEEPAGTITLSAEQADALGIAYEKTAVGPFASVVRTGGSIEAAPGDRSTVVATTSGIVSFGGRRLTEGAQVSKGSAFITLGSDGMADGNYPQQLADAKAELAKTEADYVRAEALSGNKIMTAADVDAARLAVDVARRKVAVLSQNATKGGKSIAAPQGGYITSLSVNEGDYVTAGHPLATISANRNLVLRADVPQRYLTEIRDVRTANFTTPYDGKNHDLNELGGRLIGSARSVSAGSPTLPMRFEFENKGHLTPGSVVEVYLKGAPRENILTVPVSALTEEQGAHYVYLRTSPGHFMKRAVKTGTTDGGRVEILSGIAPGDEVVTDGAYYVRLAGMSTAIPHGHTH